MPLASEAEMTLKEALAKLKSLGNEKVRAHNKKFGAGDLQFGVPHGESRKVAAKIKSHHDAGAGVNHFKTSFERC